MELAQLMHAIRDGAAIRRRRRLQPAGGQGDKLFPPTYPGEGQNSPPRHVFEVRRLNGQDVVCVLIDSVQSQANRLEEALVNAARDGLIRVPRLVVDFPSVGFNSPVPEISSLEAPHRVFDAIIRDTSLDGTEFRKSPIGKRLVEAGTDNATALLEVAPNALLFGSWNSTGEGGGIGAKFARALVSEIIGVGVPVEERVDRRTGEVSLVTAGRRTGSRIDPLGILKSVEVYKADNEWGTDKAALGKKAKQVRPSEINHGNIAPSVESLGITCDYVEQTAVISLAGLRRLRFGGDVARDEAARAYLAALGLVALLEGDRQGQALRSRCNLVADGPAPLELVAFDGSTETLDLSPDAARELHEAAFDAALKAGLELKADPIRLEPQKKLVEIVRRSQEKALADEGGETDAE